MDWEDVKRPGGTAGKGAENGMKHMPAAEACTTNPAMRRVLARTVKHADRRRQRSAVTKIRRIMAALLIIALMVSIIVISAAISYDYVIKNHHDASTRPEIVIDESEGVEFIVERGAATSQIARKLFEQGLIKNETVFKLLSKINGYDGTYKSGTHIVSPNLTYDEMMRVLSSSPVTRKVMIPEGKTFMQIVDILYNNKIIKDKERFIKCANTDEFDYDFLKNLPRREHRLEGYLFPDTYEYDYNASDREIITKMLDNFDRKFKQQYREMIANLPVEMTMDDVVKLASIIEREAKDPDDRHIIAGVLYNRLGIRTLP